MDATPLEKIAAWLDEASARSGRRNPLAMALATSAANGRASVRMVLVKGFDREQGHVSFYTNFESRKGRELAVSAWAAGVMYWEEFGGRQLRIEGRVTRVPDDIADAYFATRPAASQINAWVSAQSRELDSDDSLQQRAKQKAAEFGLDAAQLPSMGPAEIPRPAHWGGYRLWIEQAEFWTEGRGRFHERIRYTRSDEALDRDAAGAPAWHCIRLQP